ncbi:hypothetical protein BS50DRAFT_522498 [Corynespora cassiicola Philippines]|uniref:Homeobox domain-containing protein n=1 Tax=Corynespora cassiicola Philippines TaxID=1448308 RepID=A0A2T2NQP3_CORCC|nr:hypothetical protein BS50DRAFT_522498 [Corynespora cassiicola Philippines]
MAADHADAMDEFFDFARLELDGGLAPENASALPDDGIFVEEPDSTMDWQYSEAIGTNAVAALPPSFPKGPYNVYASTSPTIHMQAPIPLMTAPYSSSGSLDNSSSANNVVQPPPDIAIERSNTMRGLADPKRSSRERTSMLSPSRREFQPQAQTRLSASASHKPASAKRKGPSTRIPLEAKQMLEEEFATNPYPCNWELDIIAHQANLDVKRVRNWFNNTRARKKNAGLHQVEQPVNASSHSLVSKLSRDSLEALDKEADEITQPPQPPLAVYLAQSYHEEAATFSDIQAAMDSHSLSDSAGFCMDTSSSGSRIDRPGSVITSITSSDGTAPTTYTVSSSGRSSFGRDRRRGRRRMAWRTSPYTHTKINGLNSAGIPQDDLPFFCTFCPRAFKTKYEWIRHEDSVHALRTTWICCDTKHSPLQTCPFCGQANPDEYHLASHRYQQCRDKPESQRTFYRRDHFIQHLHHVHFANVKHPSARLGCQARLMASEGHNFGCKELAMKWRRFGAPMKADDPMLHCGFCGKRSRNWSDRCEHVAGHFIAGQVDRSTWWSERLENHLENLCNPQNVGPFRCRYCQKVFANRDAMNNHTHCRVFSCRFLSTFDDLAAENAGPPLCAQFPSPKAHHCHLCGAGYRSFHIEHAHHYHRYRLCKQDLYTSEAEFLQHLHDFHGASHPDALRHNSLIEQNFSRNKGASFEPVHFDELMQGCRVATPSGFFVDPFTLESPASTAATPPTTDQQQHVPTALRPPPRRKTTDDDHAQTQSAAPKTRHRPDPLSSSAATPPPQGPRFFRLNPLVPFLSSRIYYLRNARPANLFSDGKAVLEEVPKGHVASLVMSSGLLGMVGARFPVSMKRDGAKGMVEFALAEDDGD